MRILFIGSSKITRVCIERLISLGEDVQAVITLPNEKIYNRARGVVFDDLGVTVVKTDDISSEDVVSFVKAIKPEVIVQCGWSQKIPMDILNVPQHAIGIHQSYLPENRGAASLNWAIINDLKETGVSLFYMGEKYDEGDILNQRKIQIEERDDIRTLHEKSDAVSVEMLAETLDHIRNNTLVTKPQDNSLATYTKRRKPEDGKIEWNKTSREVWNFIRALTQPFPGAFTYLRDKKILVWKASMSDKTGTPGEVLDITNGKGVEVATGNGSVIMERVGTDGIEMFADELEIKIGDTFGN